MNGEIIFLALVIKNQKHATFPSKSVIIEQEELVLSLKSHNEQLKLPAIITPQAVLSLTLVPSTMVVKNYITVGNLILNAALAFVY